MTKNVNLRLDDNLHARLTAAAEEDNRSLQREIVSLLEAALAEWQVQMRRQSVPLTQDHQDQGS